MLVTNLREIVVFFPPTNAHDHLPASDLMMTHHHHAHSFRRVSTSIPGLTLRALCAAFIRDSVFHGEFISAPFADANYYVDESLVLPEGPPQDPDRQLYTDEEVLQTHHRCSDFDAVTLKREIRSALQFFRWHGSVKSLHSKLVVSPGDAVTGRRVQIPMGLRSCYPFDQSLVLPDTLAHLKAIQRGSAIQRMGLTDEYESANNLSLQITDIITQGTNHGCATVYKCRLTCLDDSPVTLSETLCLKLYDDRFAELRASRDQDMDLDEWPVHRWFDDFYHAEDKALTEHHAYEKLQPAQGTIVPWYHGLFEASPNGDSKS